ncbi:hypothetical protein BHM03_00012630 [Ensete ventricosum]|nr:hypothetical protein BHM03_00012630 [Ensete ventricosum]
MLQRAHQYMVVETLIAIKRDETKRPRGEQSRGHPTPPSKRREDSGATKEGIVAFTGNTNTTPRTVVTCNTKLKTLSGAITDSDMSANCPLSLTVGPLETCLPDLRARSIIKLTSSSAARPQATTTPRREKLTRDPRSGRGRCITKTLTRCTITKVPRNENALARLASSCVTDTPFGTMVRTIGPSINSIVLTVDE